MPGKNKSYASKRYHDLSDLFFLVKVRPKKELGLVEGITPIHLNYFVGVCNSSISSSFWNISIKDFISLRHFFRVQEQTVWFLSSNAGYLDRAWRLLKKVAFKLLSLTVAILDTVDILKVTPFTKRARNCPQMKSFLCWTFLESIQHLKIPTIILSPKPTCSLRLLKIRNQFWHERFKNFTLSCQEILKFHVAEMDQEPKVDPFSQLSLSKDYKYFQLWWSQFSL